MTVFISGHLDLTEEEFNTYYVPLILLHIMKDSYFIVGDAPGADTMAQNFLKEKGVTNVIVFHMLLEPRNSNNFSCIGNFKSDEERDIAMTNASDTDIAWVRPGREKSGTAKNIERRYKKWLESSA